MSEKILNPATGRLVARDGKIGKSILLKLGTTKKIKKDCPADKTRNDKTERCVKKDGTIGKSILKRQLNRVVVDVPSLPVVRKTSSRQQQQQQQQAAPKTILNPATNRYVLRTGKIGQRILANEHHQSTRVDFGYLTTNARLLHVDSFHVFVAENLSSNKTFLIWSEMNHNHLTQDETRSNKKLNYTPERFIRTMCRYNPDFLFDVYLESDELDSIQKYQSDYQPLLFSQHSWILKTNQAFSNIGERNLRVWHTDIRTRFLSSLHFLISGFVPIMFALDVSTLLRRVNRLLDKESTILREVKNVTTVDDLLIKCHIIEKMKLLPLPIQKVLRSYFLPSVRFLTLHLQLDVLYQELRRISQSKNPMLLKTMLLNENRRSNISFFNDAVVLRLTQSLTMLMDMYTLVHAFTNDTAATVILYAGQEHVHNYINVCEKLGFIKRFSLNKLHKQEDFIPLQTLRNNISI